MHKILLTTLIAMAIFSNVCFAYTPLEFSLGGLTPNNTYSDVIKMYGEPTRKLNGYSQMVSNVIMYGSNVEIGFLGDKIRYIVTTADNGWATPAGVHVGMYFDEVAKIYGADFPRLCVNLMSRILNIIGQAQNTVGQKSAKILLTNLATRLIFFQLS